MKKTVILLLAMLFIIPAFSFCGFYVAKADAKLFNKSSQVILVRDGNRSVITMSNDFRGNVKDFAMVVPVPVVLKEQDIKVVNRSIFDKLDAYSAPRMVEYYDENPCHYKEYADNFTQLSAPTLSSAGARNKNFAEASEKDYKVTIEAEYSIGEYNILILSAKESDGLKRWLTDNDYKIPSTAEEVLQPYIRNNMKFFVVKVNLDAQKRSGFNELRPIQIAFESRKFMLPIRLGMANANGDQDMIVYAFTKSGRVEATNYRTVKVPTNRNIPKFIKKDFGEFYVDLFNKAYQRENKKAVFLEYAWNVSPQSRQVKCDPCVGPPPIFGDFKQAGVSWANNGGNVFFTRLHVRYSRAKFPQDLVFQVTPNRENFQGRYIITHPASGNFSCDAGQDYLETLVQRRQTEIDELEALAGWTSNKYQYYIYEYAKYMNDPKHDKGNLIPPTPITPQNPNDGLGNGGANVLWEMLLYLFVGLIGTTIGIRAWAIYKQQTMTE